MDLGRAFVVGRKLDHDPRLLSAGFPREHDTLVGLDSLDLRGEFGTYIGERPGHLPTGRKRRAGFGDEVLRKLVGIDDGLKHLAASARDWSRQL